MSDFGRETPIPPWSSAPPPAEPPSPRDPMLAVGIALGIIVIAVAAAVIGFLATRSDNTSSSPSPSAGDGTLVTYDPGDEELIVLDRAGEVVDRIAVPGTSEDLPLTSLRGRYGFVGYRGSTLTLVSIADGRIDEFDMPDDFDFDPRLVGADDAQLVFDSSSGGDVVVLDLASGETTSMRDLLGNDAFAFVRARQVGDARTYVDIGTRKQVSLVVPFGPGADARDAWTVPGFVADVEGDRSLSLSPPDVEDRDEEGGGPWTISIYARNELVDEVTLDGPFAGGMLTGDDTALVVSSDGPIVAVDIGEGTDDEVGFVEGPIEEARPVGADRLFLVGDGTRSFLIDEAGQSLNEFGPLFEEDAEDESFLVKDQVGESRCVVIEPGFDVRIDGGEVLLLDTVTGEDLVEFEASAYILPTPDGCSAVSVFDEIADVALDGELIEFDDAQFVAAVSPDLQSVVVRDDEGDLALVDVTGDGVEDPEERIPLGGRHAAFITD